jgi:hypothetical protein
MTDKSRDHEQRATTGMYFTVRGWESSTGNAGYCATRKLAKGTKGNGRPKIGTVSKTVSKKELTQANSKMIGDLLAGLMPIHKQRSTRVRKSS